ncbi:Uncharacterised protein [Vibrio cholerae]|nr:Uncharacterised protein [Vibrio cholerae]
MAISLFYQHQSHLVIIQLVSMHGVLTYNVTDNEKNNLNQRYRALLCFSGLGRQWRYP